MALHCHVLCYFIYFWHYIVLYFVTLSTFGTTLSCTLLLYLLLALHCHVLCYFIYFWHYIVMYFVTLSTFGTTLSCTLLLYVHYLVQTRNDKVRIKSLKGPLSLLQVRSLKNCCFNSDIHNTVKPALKGTSVWQITVYKRQPHFPH